VLATPPPGPAATTPIAGSFSVTPARRYVAARPPVSLTPSRVANTTHTPLRVRVYPVLLAQQPGGAFTFEPVASELTEARRLLAVTPSSFVLRPGAARELAVRWRRLPAHARLAAVGIVYQAVPVHSSPTVQIVERLLGVNILKLPGHYRQSGQLTGVHVTQAKPGTLRFTVNVHNSGQAVSAPSRMVLSIRSRNGKILMKRRVASDIVLPGVTRSYVLDVSKHLPGGSYIVRGHVAFGSSHGLETATAFRLVGANELPTDDLRLGPLVAAGDVGGSAEAAATLRNIGTAAGSTQVTLSLYPLADDGAQRAPIATRRVAVSSLAPAHSRQLRSGLGRLEKGSYQLDASYTNAAGEPETLVADFQAHPHLGLIVRLRGVSVEHALLIPALLLLLLAGSLTWALIRERQLRSVLRRAHRDAHGG
jgi:hypothetical protein